MKSKRKSLTIGAVALACGLLAGCGPHPFWDTGSSAGDSKERRAFCKRWAHHRFGDKDFSDHIMKRIDSRVEDLDLSENQREKYEEMRLKIKANLTEAMEGRKELFAELRTEINREDPDMNAVTGLVKNQFVGMPDRMTEMLDLFVEFYDILDEDQKAQVMKVIRKRIGNG